MTTLDALAALPRVTVRNRAEPRLDGSCILYWMQRAQRGHDNPALDVAIRAGNLLGKPVVALVTLTLGNRSNARHYRFFVEGLPEIRDELAARRAELVVRGREQDIEAFAEEIAACLVVGDENPVREAQTQRRRVAARLAIPFWTVDADVVVPTRVLGREHWAARTIRPRLHEQLEQFLVKDSSPNARVRWPSPARRRVESLDPLGPLLDDLAVDRSVSPVRTFVGGPARARMQLRRFVRDRLDGYAHRRNHPELDGTSQLSPYLHFGHIGPREVALSVRDALAPDEDRDAFLEELIVRRELAVSFVRYNAHYDRLDGARGATAADDFASLADAEAFGAVVAPRDPGELRAGTRAGLRAFRGLAGRGSTVLGAHELSTDSLVRRRGACGARKRETPARSDRAHRTPRRGDRAPGGSPHPGAPAASVTTVSRTVEVGGNGRSCSERILG